MRRSNRHMRIAMISEHASPTAILGGEDAGGQNVYVDEVSRGLARRGFYVDIFTRRDHPDTPMIWQWAPGVRIINVAAGPARSILKDSLWQYMPAFRDACVSFARAEGLCYDALHGNFWMSGWVAAELREIWQIPAVQIFHATGKTKQHHQGDADTSPTARIAIEMDVVQRVDGLIAQCPSECEELLMDYAAAPDKVTLIPAAVNSDLFQPLARDEARQLIGLEIDGPVVVYVGRILPRKDVRNILHAIAQLAADETLPPVTLLVVGGENDTAELAMLRRLATELGIADRVHFAGQRQPHVLYQYYSAGDVVVTTPWYEPFGLTPLEGMACARPVIGSAVGGLTYTIQHGKTGLLVPPRDPAALASAIARIVLNPALGERLGNAGRRRVERMFTWSIVAMRTEALLQQVIATHTAREQRQHPQLSIALPLLAEEALEEWEYGVS